MDLSALTRPAKPLLHVLSATPADATDALWSLERSNVATVNVRFVRGRKARTAPAFFDEAAAALQFPYYFGENWDAFHDCLTDLAWLPASAVVVCLTEAVHVLENAPADASKFARVVETAVNYWNQPDRPETARSFHVIFHTTTAHHAVTVKRWHDLGLNLSKLH
jgi:RNAse (barnase) inhibitor barstar